MRIRQEKVTKRKILNNMFPGLKSICFFLRREKHFSNVINRVEFIFFSILHDFDGILCSAPENIAKIIKNHDNM